MKENLLLIVSVLVLSAAAAWCGYNYDGSCDKPGYVQLRVVIDGKVFFETSKNEYLRTSDYYGNSRTYFKILNVTNDLAYTDEVTNLRGNR